MLCTGLVERRHSSKALVEALLLLSSTVALFSAGLVVAVRWLIGIALLVTYIQAVLFTRELEYPVPCALAVST